MKDVAITLRRAAVVAGLALAAAPPTAFAVEDPGEAKLDDKLARFVFSVDAKQDKSAAVLLGSQAQLTEVARKVGAAVSSYEINAAERKLLNTDQPTREQFAAAAGSRDAAIDAALNAGAPVAGLVSGAGDASALTLIGPWKTLQTATEAFPRTVVFTAQAREVDGKCELDTSLSLGDHWWVQKNTLTSSEDECEQGLAVLAPFRQPGQLAQRFFEAGTAKVRELQVRLTQACATAITAATSCAAAATELERAVSAADAGIDAALAKTKEAELIDGLRAAAANLPTGARAARNRADCGVAQIDPWCRFATSTADSLQILADMLIADVIDVNPDPGGSTDAGPGMHDVNDQPDPETAGYAPPDEMGGDPLAGILPNEGESAPGPGRARYKYGEGEYRVWYEDPPGWDVSGAWVKVHWYFGGGCVHNPAWTTHGLVFDGPLHWYNVISNYRSDKSCGSIWGSYRALNENQTFGSPVAYTQTDFNRVVLFGWPEGSLKSKSDASKTGECTACLRFNERLKRMAPVSRCQGDAC